MLAAQTKEHYAPAVDRVVDQLADLAQDREERCAKLTLTTKLDSPYPHRPSYLISGEIVKEEVITVPTEGEQTETVTFRPGARVNVLCVVKPHPRTGRETVTYSGSINGETNPEVLQRFAVRYAGTL